MCGITLLLRSSASLSGGGECSQTETERLFPSIEANGQRRGPDHHARLELGLAGPTRVSLSSSVLGLRGGEVTPQPLVSADGRFVFAWNGQIFSWACLQGQAGANDGDVLFSAIQERARSRGSREAVADLLAQVEGPYAFVWIDKEQGVLVFGRDPLGRRSLLLAEEADTGVLIASVSSVPARQARLPVHEIDCSSLWSYDLRARLPQRPQPIARHIAPLLLRVPATSEAPRSRTQAERLDSSSAFEAVLAASVRSRVTAIRPAVSGVAILFSGGLDCTTLALLTHRFVPPTHPIDLLNVAFENPRSAAHLAQPYDVPDRLTGRASLAELQAAAPSRVWNFIQIDVPYAEYCAARHEVQALMYPLESVMDLSIAAALFFASRGRGTLYPSSEEVETSARVLISGLGADELLGGYSRHRAAFARGQWPELAAELQLDLTRLPTRNLGRDDRVLSHHGREARYPFLDRAVLRHLTDLDVHVKTDPRLGEGVGDKLLLRDLARSIGLAHAAGYKKRAMQFGTRSAKIDPGQGRIKGHQVVQ